MFSLFFFFSPTPFFWGGGVELRYIRLWRVMIVAGGSPRGRCGPVLRCEGLACPETFTSIGRAMPGWVRPFQMLAASPLFAEVVLDPVPRDLNRHPRQRGRRGKQAVQGPSLSCQSHEQENNFVHHFSGCFLSPPRACPSLPYPLASTPWDARSL